MIDNKKMLNIVMESYLRNSDDLIYIKDINCEYIDASESFMVFLGNKLGNIQGKTDYDLFPREIAAKRDDEDKQIISSRKNTVGIQETLTDNNGNKRYFSTSKYLMYDDEKIIGLYAVSKDITGEIELEEKCKKAKEAKKEFMAKMSHDMLTPMNGIIGLVNLTIDEDIPKTVKENLNKINNISKYLLSLINEILTMSKVEAGKIILRPEVTEAREFFESTIDMFSSTIKNKHINFSADFNNIMPNKIKIDRIRTQQILANILSNAIKFTKDQGTISFIAETVEEKKDFISYKFTIKDNGIGIDKEFLPHIYEPFEQEDNCMTSKYEGCGLGMSIVKKIVDLMDGKLEINSEKDKGTEVKVWLKFETITDKEENKNILDLSVLNGKRVLIFEDHKINAEITALFLERIGCITEIAENGLIGLSMIKDSPLNYYDFIIMDIKMPIMDGLEATKEIRNLEREEAIKIPIIAMTANTFEDDIKRSLEAGMDCHISKPIDSELLYITMIKCLNQKINIKTS